MDSNTVGKSTLAVWGGEGFEQLLCPPRAEERKAIDDAIERSLEIWPLLAENSMEAAMPAQPWFPAQSGRMAPGARFRSQPLLQER